MLLCVFVPGAGAAPLPTGTTMPGAPTIDSVMVSDGNVAVSVHANDTGSGPMIGFSVSCTSTDFGIAGHTISPASPVFVFGLTNNASYTCTATITDGLHYSDPSLPWGPFLIPAASPSGAISGAVTTNPAAPLDGYCAEATDFSNGKNTASTSIASDGSYTLIGLLDGDYAVGFVDCTGGGDYLPQWYGGGLVTPEGNRDLAHDGAIPVHVANGGTTSGIDGVLSLGAHVTGTVTDTDGHPLQQVCAGAISNSDQQAAVNTATDGTYDLLAPPGTFIVAFYDCGGSNLVTQFWDHVSLRGDAAPLTVAVGSTTTGVDAAMLHGGRVVGTVTDATTHDPIENACVSVWNDDANASGETDDTGQYDLGSVLPGVYQASFVDCAEHPTHGGTTRSDVLVISGKKTALDVELSEAATGAISGHLTTEFGTPLEGVCVAVLNGLAGEPRFAGPTGPDGAYRVDGLGSGSYFVGFFGCNGDDAAAPMPDPAHPGVTYHAQWYSNAWLGSDPDPFVDGATQVEVAPGAATVVNECFDGCNDSIWINAAAPGNHTVTLAFLSTVPGAPVGQGLAATGIAPLPEVLPEYAATCTSADGGVTGVSSSAASPVVVTGLTNGRTYACVVATTIADVTYVSGATAALVPQGTDSTAPPLRASTNAAPTNTALAFTGAAESTRLATIGLAMVLVGVVAMLVARRRRPSSSVGC